METIISKAIEGGYKSSSFPRYHKETAQLHYRDYEPGGAYSIEKMKWSDLIIDSFFWQALGRVCGWKATNRLSPRDNMVIRGQEDVNYALVFHEINLTEGWDRAVAYLQELIDGN